MRCYRGELCIDSECLHVAVVGAVVGIGVLREGHEFGALAGPVGVGWCCEPVAWLVEWVRVIYFRLELWLKSLHVPVLECQ